MRTETRARFLRPPAVVARLAASSLAIAAVLAVAAAPATEPAAPAERPGGADAGAPPGSGAPDAAAAAGVFERLKRLEGEWIGTSTKGWSDTQTYRTIAAGSVVMSTSFDAHPNETMLTLFHMDGPRLLLTHYCVAKNQPRLIASDIADGGRSVTFSFLDATGIPSRDAGHMDKVVITFTDDDHVTSRWTWYQNGEERWMEEIRHERRRRP